MVNVLSVGGIANGECGNGQVFSKREHIYFGGTAKKGAF